MIGVVVSPLAMQYREHEVTGMAGQAGFVAFLGASRFGDRAPLEEAVAARERMRASATTSGMPRPTRLLPPRRVSWW